MEYERSLSFKAVNSEGLIGNGVIRVRVTESQSQD